MAGKISQYTADSRDRFTDTDLFDISVDGGGGTWSTKSITGEKIRKSVPAELIIAVSDETTPLTVGTGKVTFRMPYAMKLTEVRASLSVAGSTSGETIIDVNESGSTIFSQRVVIDFGDKTSKTAGTQPVISDSDLADDAEITIDIDQLTGGADEAGLKVTLIGYRD
jgi:hypothetical protein